MREILVDEASFASVADVHSHLARELDFPAYYGVNLDALNDCLSDVDEPVHFSVFLADSPASEQVQEWFPKLCRTLLRASRSNDAIDVAIRASSLPALMRLIECPGMVKLLEDDGFIVQTLVGSLTQAHNEDVKRGFE